MEQVIKRRQRAAHKRPVIAAESGARPRAFARSARDRHTSRSRDRAAVGASNGDDGFSLGVSFALIPERVSDLTQLVPSVDDRCDLPGFDELLQDNEVLVG
jgi:hypothetical protein